MWCVDGVVVFGRCRLSARKKVNLKHPTSNKVHTTRVRLSPLVIDVVPYISLCVCMFRCEAYGGRKTIQECVEIPRPHCNHTKSVVLISFNGVVALFSVLLLH